MKLQDPDFKLHYGDLSRTLAEKDGNAGFLVSNCLAYLMVEGYFRHQKEELHKIEKIPSIFTEKHFMKATLEVVEYVITEDERKLLTAKTTNTNVKAQKDLVMDLQVRVKNQVYLFLGMDPFLERQLDKKKRKEI